MIDAAIKETGAARLEARSTRSARDPFFTGMTGLLLVVVLAAFVPTLYLRPFFDVPAVPAYLHVHGAVLTLWFIWLFGQSILVQVGSIGLHRSFGIAGAMLAAMVVLTSLMVQFDKGPRIKALGQDMQARLAADSTIFWSNIGSLLIFAAFVTVAMLWRTRSATHKRLLFLASVGLIGPAMGRIARWPIWSSSGLSSYTAFDRYFGIGGIALFMLMIVGYDLAKTRRINLATVIACALIVAVRIVASLMASSPAGLEFVRELA
jgi:hypothetical protein